MLDCGNYTKILEQNYKNPGQFNPTSDFTLNECARINYKLVSKLNFFIQAAAKKLSSAKLSLGACGNLSTVPFLDSL